MPITLVTGLPGHGKTLYALARLKPQAEGEKRPVFHNDVPGLAIDGWTVQPAAEWHDLAAGSYMLIDEAQKVFPIRARSAAVPEHVSELETHRHKGIDLFLITQHPMLIDSHVRKLVDRHFHVVRTFGLERATVYEFPTGVQDQPEKNKRKQGVVRHEWKYPKEAYSWYRSAELHTVKRRLPAKVYLFFLALLAIPFALAWAYWRLFVHHDAPKASAGVHAAAAPGAASGAYVVRPGSPDDVARMQQAYLAPYQPRIVGLPFTAPVYDSLTKPVEAPYPAVCAYSADFPCRCWSQRGFALETPKNLCERLAREPMDPWWRRRGPNGLEIQNYAGGSTGEPPTPAAPASASQSPVGPVASAQ